MKSGQKPEGLGGKAGRNRAVGQAVLVGKHAVWSRRWSAPFAGPSRGGGVLYYHSCEGVKAWSFCRRGARSTRFDYPAGGGAAKKADVVIYAGSLVNPVLLGLCSAQCRIFNNAEMTLEQVLSTMEQAEREQKQTVRLHTGDPCLYGAIQEQMDALKKRGIPYTLTPGVSSFCGAAAAVEGEYTLPGISQTVIITRMAAEPQSRSGRILPLWPSMGRPW